METCGYGRFVSDTQAFLFSVLVPVGVSYILFSWEICRPVNE